MANRKRYWHHVWVNLKKLKAWYLVTGFVVFVIISVLALRHNNLTALHLRDNVIQADKQNGDVESALRSLREYTYSHMNAQLSSGPNSNEPPIQLRYLYDRLITAEKNRVSTINATVYGQAQTNCEKLFPHGISGGGRVPCVQAYVSHHGVKEKVVADSLYKFNFVSPFWSPDLAGWCLVVTALLGFLLIVRVGLFYWLKAYLNQHA